MCLKFAFMLLPSKEYCNPCYWGFSRYKLNIITSRIPKVGNVAEDRFLTHDQIVEPKSIIEMIK